MEDSPLIRVLLIELISDREISAARSGSPRDVRDRFEDLSRNSINRVIFLDREMRMFLQEKKGRANFSNAMKL